MGFPELCGGNLTCGSIVWGCCYLQLCPTPRWVHLSLNRAWKISPTQGQVLPPAKANVCPHGMWINFTLHNSRTSSSSQSASLVATNIHNFYHFFQAASICFTSFTWPSGGFRWSATPGSEKRGWSIKLQKLNVQKYSGDCVQRPSSSSNINTWKESDN